MTRSQDFDAMSAHYGYGPVCAVLSQRFGATFEFTTTGGNCTALVATLEGGYEVLITDGGDMVGSLTPLSQRDGSEGFAIGSAMRQDRRRSGSILRMMSTIILRLPGQQHVVHGHRNG
jgi:antitoxin (DNA-binding transcriptional repressor) of toxin-antitoxin stability system